MKRSKGYPAMVGEQCVHEVVGGESYDYYPLGDYIVAAPGVCGGRPTFKYTRIEVEVVLDLLAAGQSLEQLVDNFQGRVPKEAIQEALRLAAALLKREAIPQLLRQCKGATFVTTNVPDFWQRILAHTRYSIVCPSLPNERLHQLPALLRRLFRQQEFRTRAGRMGKVIRATREQLQYYTIGDNRIHPLTWSD
jgi:uncharacterized protein (DUF433 family)